MPTLTERAQGWLTALGTGEPVHTSAAGSAPTAAALRGSSSPPGSSYAYLLRESHRFL